MLQLATTQETIYGLLQRQGEELTQAEANITALQNAGFLNQSVANTLYKNINDTSSGDFLNKTYADTLYMNINFTDQDTPHYNSSCIADHFLSAAFFSKVVTGTVSFRSVCVGKAFCESSSCNSITELQFPNVLFIDSWFCFSGSCKAATPITITNVINIGNFFCSSANSCDASTGWILNALKTIGTEFCSYGGCRNATSLWVANVSTVGLNFCYSGGCAKMNSIKLDNLTTVASGFCGSGGCALLKSLKVQKVMINPTSMNLTSCPALSTFTCTNTGTLAVTNSYNNLILLSCGANVLQCA